MVGSVRTQLLTVMNAPAMKVSLVLTVKLPSMHVPPSHVRMELAVLTRWVGSSVRVPRAGLGHSVRDTSMSVHQIRVSMGAHAWTASTAIGACVPQAGAGLTVSWTRTSAAVVPV